MSDNTGLQHIPFAEAALVPSEARSSLIIRGRNDAKSLLSRKTAAVLRARVKLNGKWGLIDKTGTFVVEPFYCEIREFSCGVAAFSDAPVQRSQRLYQRAIDDMGGREDKPLEYPGGRGYHEAGNWGFVNEQWNIAIPARFKWVRDFSEDLAGVAHNGKWGFLSKDGRFAIEPRFEAVGDFFEGICLAKFNGKYGFINPSGEFIVQPRFTYLWNFSEGLACAEINRKYGFIDKNGEILIPPLFDWATDFCSGAAHVELNGKSCLLDRQGTVFFTCTEEKEGDCVFFKEQVGDFFEDLALVAGRYYARASDCGHDVQGCDGVCHDDPCTCPASKRICRDCKWDIGYYIDRTGEPIPMPEEIIGIGQFSEGLAVIGKPWTRWEDGQTYYRMGYINTQGEVVIAPQYDSAEDFADGTARVYTEQEEWRLIDKSGNFVDFAVAGGGDHCKDNESIKSEELVRIEADGLYGFADRSGNVVIEPRFSWVGHFSNGMARFSTDGESAGKWGYIDRAGATVISPQFDGAEDFEAVAP